MRRSGGSRRPDEAVSEVVGIVLMIVVSVLMAAVLFFWVGIGDEPPDAPLAAVLKLDGPLASSTQQIVVVSVSTPIAWSDIRIEIDGSPFTYESALGAQRTFCVKDETESCIATADWDPTTAMLEAGQLIRLRDSRITDAPVRIIHTESNGVIASLTVTP